MNELNIPETYCYSTDFEHETNEYTMHDFLENELPYKWDVLVQDGTYAEIEFEGKRYGVHASGNGDFKNHKIEFEKL